MPFSRPTLTQLRQQTAADINAALPAGEALLRWSNLGIIGDVLAALAAGHYGYLDWIARQAVPFTATDEYLEGWAALIGITRKGAVAADGTATFTGAPGAVIPAGTRAARADGAAYVTASEVAIASSGPAAGSATVGMTAAAGGAAGNMDAGTALTLASPIAGVNSTGQVATPFTGGADVEADADLRNRMLAEYAAPPQGGAASDYVQWALEVPGITRAWTVPQAMGPGTVTVLFMMDLANAADDGFPQGTDGVATDEARGTAATGDQLTLANALYLLQPVTALVYAVAPTPNVIDLTIAGLASAPTPVRDAIAAAFARALLQSARPGGVTFVSAIESAIAGVTGAAGFVLTAITASAGSVSPGATGNIQSDPNCLPVAGSISYI